MHYSALQGVKSTLFILTQTKEALFFNTKSSESEPFFLAFKRYGGIYLPVKLLHKCFEP